jgi:hypothetical protein
MRRSIIVVVLFAVTASAAAPAARATFPGHNGKVAYNSDFDCEFDAS